MKLICKLGIHKWGEKKYITSTKVVSSSLGLPDAYNPPYIIYIQICEYCGKIKEGKEFRDDNYNCINEVGKDKKLKSDIKKIREAKKIQARIEKFYRKKECVTKSDFESINSSKSQFERAAYEIEQMQRNKNNPSNIESKANKENIVGNKKIITKYCKFLGQYVEIHDIPELYLVCWEGSPVKGAKCENSNCVYHNIIRMSLYTQQIPPDLMNDVAKQKMGSIDYTEI